MERILNLLAEKPLICLAVLAVALVFLFFLTMNFLVKNSPTANEKEEIQWKEWTKKSRAIYYISESFLVLVSLALDTTVIAIVVIAIKRCL